MKVLVEGQPVGGNDEDQEAPEPYYASLDAFVQFQFAPMWRREPIDGRTLAWCPEWWRHAKGSTRLDAMWRAWEHLRLEPALGISSWLRDHADHHMPLLMSPDGPFKYCSPTEGHSSRLTPLPVLAPPAGLFGG